MANNMYNMCLVGAMDRLWFHQIILLSQPNVSLITPQINLEEESIWFKSQSPILSTSSSSLEDDQKDEDIETDLSVTTDELDSPPKTPMKERPRRRSTSFNNSRNRSHSSLSPTMRKLTRLSSSTPRLEKSMSCRSLGELELEEVKGFLDLGFTFKKEHLSPRMMSLIPGLQRLNSLNRNKVGEEEEDEEERSGLVSRPYLSEAWLIKRPSSPLLNLKIPRDSEPSDMKKHLRFWARTVASEVQQES